MSDLINISTAIAAMLESAKADGAFDGLPEIGSIERRWAPTWGIPDVETLRIGVIPVSMTRERATRLHDFVGPVVAVCLMAHLPKLDDTSNTVIDSHVELAELVASVIAAGKLPDPADSAILDSLEHDIIDRDRLTQSRSFFSTITTTWRVAHAARNQVVP